MQRISGFDYRHWRETNNGHRRKSERRMLACIHSACRAWIRGTLVLVCIWQEGLSNFFYFSFFSFLFNVLKEKSRKNA